MWPILLKLIPCNFATQHADCGDDSEYTYPVMNAILKISRSPPLPSYNCTNQSNSSICTNSYQRNEEGKGGNNMKAKKIMGLVLVLLVALSLAPLSAQAAEPKPIVLRLAHFVPEKPAGIGGVTDQFFADEVYKRTDGRVKIEIYWLQTLGQTKELLGLVRDGTVDMAAFPSGYFPSQFPFWRWPNGTPFIMSTIEEAVQTAIKIPQLPCVQEEIRKHNVKLLFSHVMGSYQLFAKKPVTTFKDLRGLKVRTYGDVLPRCVQSAKAVGVSVFPPEVYEATQKGVIDGGLYDLIGGYGQKIHEVAPNVNLWNIMSIVAWGIWVNLDTWNKLPADVRQIMVDVSKDTMDFERDRAIKYENETREILTKEGAIFRDVPDRERQKWVNACPDFLDEFIKEMDKQGKGDDARQFKKTWMEIVEKY
jgi:TRAP-type C4-dicarboxylate transport system substrate-binding protein